MGPMYIKTPYISSHVGPMYIETPCILDTTCWLVGWFLYLIAYQPFWVILRCKTKQNNQPTIYFFILCSVFFSIKFRSSKYDLYTSIYGKQINLFFMVQVFQTIVFIFVVIFTTFRPMCPPAFRCLSNSGAYTELRITSFI